MSPDNRTMDYEQKSRIDSVKAARRYSRALRERKRCDKRRAKDVVLIAAVLLCVLVTTFGLRTSGSLRRTADSYHYAGIPAHMAHLVVLR
jgi:hypothetical protein